MKSNLSKSVADHIISQNARFKQQIIYLKRDLKRFQDKMVESLDYLAESFSTKSQQYKELLLFKSPFQCLTVFVQHITKSASFSIKTSQQNSALLKINKQFQRQIRKIKDESSQRTRKEEELIQELNSQIQQKKQRLIELQQNYQDLLKAKKLAEKELNQTKQYMKILRLKLYEQQRQKLTQIIVANKKQIVDFRRNMQMQSYKQQVQLKRQIAQRQAQIKLLTRNVQDMANSNLSISSDLSVLEKILKPIRESTQLKEEIVVLRRQLSASRQQLRERNNRMLGLEGQLAGTTLERDNLESHNQRLQIEKSLLGISLEEKAQEYQKCIKDKKAMQLYYSQKWHNQFSKVKENLQSKFSKKTKSLQDQFQRKIKQVQWQIEAFVERIRLLKVQLNAGNARNQQLEQTNICKVQVIDGLRQSLRELHSVLGNSQKLHCEDLLARQVNWLEEKRSLHNQIKALSSLGQAYQSQIQNINFEHLTQKCSLLAQNSKEIQAIHRESLREKEQLQRKFKKQLRDLQTQYCNSKQAIEAFRLDQVLRSQGRQKQMRASHQQQLKQAETLLQVKLQRASQKLAQSEVKNQKLRKGKQSQKQQLQVKIAQMDQFLHQRQHQLISRDVQIQQYRKMRGTYMDQIGRMNSLLTESNFQRESLKTELASLSVRLQQTQKQTCLHQAQRHRFKDQLREFERVHRKQVAQLNKIHGRLVAQYKTKIWELQKMFQRRPMKSKDFQHIQDLQKQNDSLKTEIHVKQAENLILNEVKQYYEQKAIRTVFGQYQTQQNRQRLFSSTNKPFNQQVPIDFMKQTLKHNKPLYIKKPTARNTRLLSTSMKKIVTEDEQNNRTAQSKQVKQMKFYLESQKKKHNNSLLACSRPANLRINSSMN